MRQSLLRHSAKRPAVRRDFIVGILLVALMLAAGPAGAQAQGGDPPGLGPLPVGPASLEAGPAAGAAQAAILDDDLPAPKEPTRSVHRETGLLRFWAAPAGAALFRDPAAHASADAQVGAAQAAAAANAFLQQYAGQFGAGRPTEQLRLQSSVTEGAGQIAFRYTQVERGVPVFAGELIVHANASGAVSAAMGELLPDLDQLDLTATVSATAAAEIARGLAARRFGFSAADAQASTPQLTIHNPALLGGPGLRISRLAWRVEVTHPQRADVRLLALIDAHTGGTLLSFNQTPAALYREVYNNRNSAYEDLPGEKPARVEGDAPSRDAEVNNAYDYAGAVYDFLFTHFGRDSLDDRGMKLIQTVRFCNFIDDCPYPNAFWSGTQMVYGEGYASADDVVGHELAHGLTQYTSGLHYYMQAGAIDEAISDIFGELIDQAYTNGADDDRPQSLWLIGEDLPGGSVRSLSDPPMYKNPDSTDSSLYSCDWADGGGVHTNSGVGAKAAYLMAAGGDFNGYRVGPLGADKTARLFYAVELSGLTGAADYQDLNDSLTYACSAMIGRFGFTPIDCDNVRKALAAVRMDRQPQNCEVTDAPVCSLPDFENDFSAGLGGWAPNDASWKAIPGALVSEGVPGGYASAAHTAAFHDFTYEATLARSGCDRCASSLIVRGSAAAGIWPRGIAFHINRSGQYSVARWSATGEQALQPWTAHPALLPGAAANRLKIVSSAGRLAFYANNVLVWAGSDYHFGPADETPLQVGVGMYRDAASSGNRLEVRAVRLSGGTPQPLFTESFEQGLGRWRPTFRFPLSLSWRLFYGYTNSGRLAAWGPNPNWSADYTMTLMNPVLLPVGQPIFLRFVHYYALENMYDGGLVEYMTETGPWEDVGPLFIDRGYPARIFEGFGSTIAGRAAFTGWVNGLTSSRADLSSLGGQAIRLRFRVASDNMFFDDGWLVDDIQIYTCAAGEYQYTLLPGLARP